MLVPQCYVWQVSRPPGGISRRFIRNRDPWASTLFFQVFVHHGLKRSLFVGMEVTAGFLAFTIAVTLPAQVPAQTDF